MSKYFNYKRFETILTDQVNFSTECNSITFDNRGEEPVYLWAEGTVMEILAGEVVSHNNEPGVTEITYYDKVTFGTGTGTKKLFVTREYVTENRPANIYQSPKEE